MSVKPNAVQKPASQSNISIIINSIKNGIYNHIYLKTKGFIIHMWINDFEDQYLKTLKVVIDNATDPKSVVTSVYKRMEDYDYKDKCIILVRYIPNNNFSVLASYTKEEIEYAEFQKWKKKYKKEVK